MSYIQVYSAPGLNPLPISAINPDVTIFKWIDSLGGGIFDGPLEEGTSRPDGKPASVGVATTNDIAIVTIEYHFAAAPPPTLSFALASALNRNNYDNIF